MRKTSRFLGDMPGKLGIIYDKNDPSEYFEQLEDILEAKSGRYSVPSYYDMIETIKKLIKSDKNMKKKILNELKYVNKVITHNLRKKVPALFR